ncbi:BlaI/MecI/CopY family transcriptional regulator [Dyadobacter sp. CY261]|uniref:BlaI/MecI/CopY family transcriptional regulator n=1 Tax=Dyadobacter sp. CY261 TaxID=2907203 RepID=UPI001F328F6D|nr:BlaI/MecI/CopY family transcriptional regulator [Dyadobacter sp. CY261]MCF0070170.1 BlaI/MecI/CopY family transcriptional regulator [Dyadobacter sp. CY261]
MEKLTAQEEDALLAIWKTGEGNVKSFMEEMTPPVPPYTTVASTIKNLEKKGYLSSRMIGNAYLYAPAVTEETYKQKFMGNVVKDYFENSYKELVSFFAEKNKISADELREIIGLIEEKNKH